ncbi:MAG: hypothetical protein GY943_28190, partial [Chloroflexi bacterium]|nr:hypothetical protein [Chloroflexota bacterium]
AQSALDAGAEYISSSRLDFDLMAFCGKQDVLYIPTVIGMLAAQAMQQAGGTFVRLRTGGSDGSAYVTRMQEVIPGMQLLVTGDIGLENIGDYAKSGADAVVIGDALVAQSDQPMAALISRARKLQKAWRGGRQKRLFNPFQSPISHN